MHRWPDGAKIALFFGNVRPGKSDNSFSYPGLKKS